MIPPAGIRNELGDPVPWEACLTLNNNWGYSSSDRHYKSAEMVIHMLVAVSYTHLGIQQQSDKTGGHGNNL